MFIAEFLKMSDTAIWDSLSGTMSLYIIQNRNLKMGNERVSIL